MRGVSKTTLIGNLGADPEMRETKKGEPVANISVATTETWRDKDSGEKKDRTEWHRVVMFGGLAKIAEEYLSKGSKVYIEGTLRTSQWKDKDGCDRQSTEIVAREMNMLDKAKTTEVEQAPAELGQDEPAPKEEEVVLEDDRPF